MRARVNIQKKDFLRNPIIRPAEAGLLADLNGDGNVDYIGGNSADGSLLLFLGNNEGNFIKAPLKFNLPPLKGLHALSALTVITIKSIKTLIFRGPL